MAHLVLKLWGAYALNFLITIWHRELPWKTFIPNLNRLRVCGYKRRTDGRTSGQNGITNVEVGAYESIYVTVFYAFYNFMAAFKRVIWGASSVSALTSGVQEGLDVVQTSIEGKNFPAFRRSLQYQGIHSCLYVFLMLPLFAKQRFVCVLHREIRYF